MKYKTSQCMRLYLHRNEGILMFTLHLETVSTAKTRYIHLLQKAGIPMYSYTFKLSNTQFDVCTGACTMMSYMSLWSIPIDWRDLVTKINLGTSINIDESR